MSEDLRKHHEQAHAEFPQGELLQVSHVPLAAAKVQPTFLHDEVI